MIITEGQNKIKGMQLGSKGLYRWHTTCCNMPLANTMKAFGKYSNGEMSKDVHIRFPVLYMPKILGFMIKGMFRKMNNPYQNVRKDYCLCAAMFCIF